MSRRLLLKGVRSSENEIPSQLLDGSSHRLVGLSTGLANGTIEISMSSIELNFDEKNECVLIWNEQVIMSCVVMSRTKK